VCPEVHPQLVAEGVAVGVVEAAGEADFEMVGVIVAVADAGADFEIELVGDLVAVFEGEIETVFD